MIPISTQPNRLGLGETPPELVHNDVAEEFNGSVPTDPLVGTQGMPSSELGGSGRGWCRANIAGFGSVMGEVVGFDMHLIVISIGDIDRARLQTIAVGAPATLAIGLHGRVAKGMEGTVVTTLTDYLDRNCVAFDLSDETRTGTRRAERIPFHGRVDAMLIDGRGKIDAGSKFTAFNLSKRGMGVLCEREIARQSHLLLRFTVPQNRAATVQVRAVVNYCREVGEKLFQIGLEFERMGATQAQLIGGALAMLAATAEPGGCEP